MPISEAKDREPVLNAKNPSAPKPSPKPPVKPAFNPHPKPRAEGETDEAYAKRTANFAKSQERLKSVGITGGVNNAKPGQLKAFEAKYGHSPSGLKPKQGPSSEPQKLPSKEPKMDASNPSFPKAGDKNGPSVGSQKFSMSRDKNNIGMSLKDVGDKVRSARSSAPPLAAAKKMLSGGGSKLRKQIRMERRLKSKAPMPMGKA